MNRLITVSKAGTREALIYALSVAIMKKAEEERGWTFKSGLRQQLEEALTDIEGQR